MKEDASGQLSGPASGASAAQVRLRLLSVGGGNAELARGLRGAAWQEYCAADCPFGASEEGMLLWLTYGRHGRLQ